MSERKGILVILFLITSILVIPRQFLSKNSSLFLLPVSLEDTIISEQDANKVLPSQPHFAKTKFTKIKTVELNTADSATLIKIRGIGPYYASRIIRYRNRLGGFQSVKQLKELKMKYFNVDSCAFFFTVNPHLILKRDMDTMSFKAILRHPYLEYEDVQMIFNAKRKYGRLSYLILEEKGILAAYKLKKIKPYFK